MRALVLVIMYWLFVGSGATYAQWQLRIENSEPDKELLRSYLPSVEYASLVEVQQAVDTIIITLQRTGYFQAYVQPLPTTDSLIYRVRIHPGSPFRWAYLQSGNLDPIMQAQSGYREELFLQQPFQYDDFQQLVENCLNYSENHGYPFASVRLKDVKIEGQEISAALDYQSGSLIHFGELNVVGTERVNPEFLEAYLGIRTGSVYSEKKVAQITSRLQLLPYLLLEGPVETRFQNEVADLYLPLSYQPTNQIDGILSVLPDAGRDGELLLTGELNILLRNLGRTGKTFSLNWQRLQVASQQLAITYDHPNLLRSPLGIGFNFSLLKEDTLFLNRNVNLNVSYVSGSSQRITAFGDWRSSRLTGENSFTTETVAPPLADVSIQGGGLRYEWNQVDRLLFPRRGYSLSISGRGGRKSVSFWTQEDAQNDLLTYQTVESDQWAGELSFAQYYMLGSSVGLFHRLRGAGLLDEQLFLNELYRLGGIKSLRGFNDNWFFASQFALSNLELRWLLEPESAIPSYLFAFYDQAWLREEYQGYRGVDVPLGIGAGISVSTSAGLFSLVYALGKSQDQELNFSTSKVHFGYISRF
ncbi:MAG: BamA/TamA family outer membrane protein [Bacteroidota bacterium]